MQVTGILDGFGVGGGGEWEKFDLVGSGVFSACAISLVQQGGAASGASVLGVPQRGETEKEKSRGRETGREKGREAGKERGGRV